MRSKLFVNPDGTAKMQQIRIEAHGKDGATGIKAVSRLANMVNSLKACKTPQEVYDRYLQITGYCKCCLDCEFIDKKSADDLMCLAAYLAGNEQAGAVAQAEGGKSRKGQSMKRVYICSPYRAKDGAELDRNIEYAQALTKQALNAGLAPITPHLYMTQCLDDKKPQERAQGMAAGMALLKTCDFVIAGVKYGVSEGMSREIQTADRLGIEVVNADRLAFKLLYDKQQEETKAERYAKMNCCNFCKGSRLHTCTGYDCRLPYRAAYEFAITHIELL